MAQVEEIVKSITRKFLKKIEANKNNISLRLTDKFKEIISREFKNTSEYLSIINGTLRSDFGLGGVADGLIAVESIVQAIEDSTWVSFESSNTQATFTIEVFLDNFEDALGARGAEYKSDGGEVKWLKWLLFSGSDIVNADYGVLSKEKGFKKSRTGNSIMVKVRGKIKNPFIVAEEFQGTKDNNWITRIAEICFPQFVYIVSKEADKIIAEGMGTI